MFSVTPDWNGWAGRSRLLHSAWDLLVEKDALDLSLKEIAQAAGTSPSLFHRTFASRSALFAEVANAGMVTLLVNVADDSAFEELATSWIRFAQARPRHYLLMFSSEFSEHDGVSLRRHALGKRLHDLLEERLERAAHKSEMFMVYAMIHGAASLVASGLPRQPLQATTVEAIDAYLAAIKRS